MSLNDYIQMGFYLLVLLLAVKPLGIYMARIYEGRPTGLNVWLAPIERWIYRLCGVKQEQGMSWKTYAFAMMLFNILGVLVVYAIQRFQANLPLNPMAMTAVTPDSSFNTAVSFATNTNWQGYGGESTMSYLTQMMALTVQNFVSAATGMVVASGFNQRVYSKANEHHREFLGGYGEDCALYLTAFGPRFCFSFGFPGDSADF